MSAPFFAVTEADIVHSAAEAREVGRVVNVVHVRSPKPALFIPLLRNGRSTELSTTDSAATLTEAEVFIPLLRNEKADEVVSASLCGNAHHGGME